MIDAGAKILIHCVFQTFSGAEIWNFGGGDGNFFTSLRITAGTSRTFAIVKVPKPTNATSSPCRSDSITELIIAFSTRLAAAFEISVPNSNFINQL